MDSGAAWLENEIGTFDELYKQVVPSHEPIDFFTLGSVAAGQDALLRMPLEYLVTLERFTACGSTDTHSVFQARDAKNAAIALAFIMKCMRS